jgi:hypothetical protein
MPLSGIQPGSESLNKLYHSSTGTTELTSLPLVRLVTLTMLTKVEDVLRERGVQLELEDFDPRDPRNLGKAHPDFFLGGDWHGCQKLDSW